MVSPPRRLSLYAFLILSLFILGSGLRLFDLTDQPIDFHPTRQLRGAIVARGIYYQVLPTADEAEKRQAANFAASTGQYEPPVLEMLTAIAYLAIGQEAFWMARIINTLFWLIAGLALLALVRRMLVDNLRDSSAQPPKIVQTAALAALAYFLVLPFGVQASRSFQPDPGMVMGLALACWSIWRWSEAGSWRWAATAGVLCGLAILIKAVIIFTIGGALLGVALYAAHRGSGSWRAALVGLLRNLQLWVIGLLAITPTAVYYLSRQGRAAEYFSSWTLALSHLLLRPSFYAGWANLVQELLTPFALIAALVGLWLARGRTRALLAGLWLGYIAYGLFLPYQMDTHSYYHLQLVYIVALSMLPAIQALITYISRKPVLWQTAAAISAVVLLAYSSWQALIPLYQQDFHNEPEYWQEIASYLPQDGKIVALTQDYGYRLMYYGKRKVTLWPNRGEIRLSELRGSSKEFEQFFAKRIQDKSYFLVTAFRQFEDQPVLQATLAERYPILAQGQGYVIFDLTNPYHHP